MSASCPSVVKPFGILDVLVYACLFSLEIAWYNAVYNRWQHWYGEAALNSSFQWAIVWTSFCAIIVKTLSHLYPPVKVPDKVH